MPMKRGFRRYLRAWASRSIPSIEKQKLIINLDKLGKKESELLEIIREKKKKLISYILEKNIYQD